MKIQKLKLRQTLYNSLILLLMLIVAGCGDKSGASGNSAITTNDGTTLTWDAPTTNADGSDITDLAGYNLYYKATENDNYNNTDVVNAGDVLTIGVNDIPALSSGTTYDFVGTAYDASGNESDYSNEVSIPIP